MAIRHVETIRISQGSSAAPPGKFMGADIIGMSMRLMGTGAGGTQVSVTLANETGKFTAPRMSYMTPYKIDILGTTSSSPTLTFFMYLIKREESRSAGESSMVVTFTDGSHILDRTYVGLLNTHMSVNTGLRATNNFGLIGKNLIKTKNNVGHQIPLMCEPCGATPQAMDPAQPLREVIIPPSNPLTQRTLSKAGPDLYVGNNVEGGFLFVGEEEWSQTDCEIHNVSYRFQDLINIASQYGITIQISNRAPNYKANYTGTLREVLDKWCADFGFTYIWDYSFMPGRVLGIDLTTNSLNGDVKEIEASVRAMKSTKVDVPIVESIRSSATMEGTFRQFVCATYKQASAPRSSSRTFFYKVGWAAVRPAEMFSLQDTDYRGLHDFTISCVLSKVNHQARTLFNVRRGYYRPLGLSNQLEIRGTAEKEKILNYCVSGDTYKDFLDNFTTQGWDSPQAKYKMLIGSYNENLESEYQKWEGGVADLLGRWMYSPIDEREFNYFKCPQGGNFRFLTQATLSPRATPYEIKNNITMTGASAGLQQTVPLPFTNFLNRAMMNSNLWSLFGTKRVSFFQRQGATWGTRFQDFRDFFLYDSGSGVGGTVTSSQKQSESVLADLMPRYQKITGELRLRIYNSLSTTSVWQYIRLIEQDKNAIPMLIIIPEAAKIDQLVQFSNLYPARNNLESWWSNPNQGTVSPEQACANNTLCEKQSLLEQLACQCPPVTFGTPSGNLRHLQQAQTMPWTEGFASNWASAFNISINGFPRARTMPVILPCGTWPWGGTIQNGQVPFGGTYNLLYYGNLRKQVQNVRYSDKVIQILHEYQKQNPNSDGSTSIGAGNVSEIRVLNPNLTSNIINRSESAKNKIVNIYVPGVGFATLQQYFQFLKFLNGIGSINELLELSIKFGGVNFGKLRNGNWLASYVHPRYGLSNLNFTLGEGGLSTEVSWRTRPITPPKQDIFMKYIGPTPVNPF